MNLPIRSFLALSIVAIVLAACGTTVAAPGQETPRTPTETPAPSQPATPTASPEPTKKPMPSATPVATPEPKPTPAERKPDGTITVYPGIASGPGGTIAEVLTNGPSGDLPALVNGVLFRDTDRAIYLASSVSDATVPTFDGPMLKVLDYPNDGPSWDMANAELIGLEEADGIVFKVDAQILGTIEVR